jgi:flavodoxin
MKVLIAFYSLEGNTKFLAKHIAKTIGADMLEIKTIKDVKTKGLTKYLWGGRQAMMGQKPEIHPTDKDWKEYDMIFVGTPVWAWTASPPIMSYLTKSGIAGKKVALFCCFEGNSGSAFEKMRLAIPDNDFKGEEAFFAPLKKNKDETLMKAVSWAFMMMK